METEASYADGITHRERHAQLTLSDRGLGLRVDGGPLFIWDFAAIRLIGGDASITRFGREENGIRTGEWLGIADAAFAEALIARCPALAGGASHEAKLWRRIVLSAVLALLALGALIIYGLPRVAGWIAPFIPWKTEVALGRAVEAEFLRSMGGPNPRFCEGTASPAARQALNTLVNRLTSSAQLPGPVSVRVLDSAQQNAFALPGGRIILLRGLIERAEHPDEVAGVLAHELGHVANRDAMRAIIHAGGLSFLAGTLLGDFTGAGALMVSTKLLLGNRYSRANEAEADAYAIALMREAGGDIRYLGRFLERVVKQSGERQFEMLLTHPVTEDRIAAIEREAGRAVKPPLLMEADWRALRAICRAG